ncbi:hypothetical protein MHYP_G00311950 [Metynnis hypsauchen]
MFLKLTNAPSLPDGSLHVCLFIETPALHIRDLSVLSYRRLLSSSRQTCGTQPRTDGTDPLLTPPPTRVISSGIRTSQAGPADHAASLNTVIPTPQMPQMTLQSPAQNNKPHTERRTGPFARCTDTSASSTCPRPSVMRPTLMKKLQ